jgi:hypothetical protein
MLARHDVAISRRVSRPRSAGRSALLRLRGRRECRALASPMARLRKKAGGSHRRVSRDIPAFPAQWLERLIRDFPGDRLDCPRRLRARRTASLTPAPGGQDHTTSPCVSGRSSAHKVRCNPPRPPHPALNVRDDRDTPLYRGGRGGLKHYFCKNERCLFLSEGLDKGQINENRTDAQGSRIPALNKVP